MTTTIENPDKNIEQVPDKAGVYGYWAKSKNTGKQGKCKYVGQSDSLRRRLREHLSDDEDNQCLKDFVKKYVIIMVYDLMPNSSEDDRMKKEKEWVQKYSPECNK